MPDFAHSRHIKFDDENDKNVQANIEIVKRRQKKKGKAKKNQREKLDVKVIILLMASNPID